MSKAPTESDLDEVRSMCLAAVALISNGLTMLEEKGAVTKEDVDDVFKSALLTLEKADFVGEKAAHGARTILCGFAEGRGIAMRRPS